MRSDAKNPSDSAHCIATESRPRIAHGSYWKISQYYHGSENLLEILAHRLLKVSSTIKAQPPYKKNWIQFFESPVLAKKQRHPSEEKSTEVLN